MNINIARKVADECCRCLKNDGVLPLKKSAKIAVVGPLADAKLRYGCSYRDTGKSAQSVSLLPESSNPVKYVIIVKGSYLVADSALEMTLTTV